MRQAKSRAGPSVRSIIDLPPPLPPAPPPSTPSSPGAGPKDAHSHAVVALAAAQLHFPPARSSDSPAAAARPHTLQAGGHRRWQGRGVRSEVLGNSRASRKSWNRRYGAQPRSGRACHRQPSIPPQGKRAGQFWQHARRGNWGGAGGHEQVGRSPFRERLHCCLPPPPARSPLPLPPPPARPPPPPPCVPTHDSRSTTARSCCQLPTAPLHLASPELALARSSTPWRATPHRARMSSRIRTLACSGTCWPRPIACTSCRGAAWPRSP